MASTYAEELLVEHRPCLILHVTVVKGRNVTKGWGDYVDMPDPYVQLQMYRTPDARKRTATVNNQTNPDWNETFTYYLDPDNKNILYITLKEDNYVSDAVLGRQMFNIEELRMGKWTKKTFKFNNKVSEVDIELKKEIDAEPNLRYSLDLCEEETRFLTARKSKTMGGMKKLLGTKAPKSIKELPTVAVIGSGGGFRAMVGFCGVFKALTESGVLDCVTYMGGLSGSAWFVSTLSSHPKWPNIDMPEFLDEVKNNIDSRLMWLMTPSRIGGYMEKIMDKWNNGQPISFTDFFGHLVGETLLKDRLDSKLTDQQLKMEGGNIPMPLYTCVHVKKDVSAKSFQEWIEFNPYEIGMPKYGSYMKSRYFGSKFFLGQLARKFPEPPLHFLQGIWGSAFCIMFDRLFEDNKNKDPVEMMRLQMQKELDKEDQLSDGSEDEDEDDHDVTDNGAKSRKLEEKTERAPADEKKEGFWSGLFEDLVESQHYTLLSTRSGRAGVIHNFLRGISTHAKGTDHVDAEKEKYTDKCNVYTTHVKKQFVVDAGLTFNSPYPVVVRQQRGVDIILSFDFSGRPSDSTPPFQELILAAEWCKKNGHPFPPIDLAEYEKDGLKELYIFRHPTDPYCPIVLHFVLVNVDFRKYKRPGVPRKTQAEKDFADFKIFDDPDTPYSTFNFTYTHKDFDRLTKLMEFNTLKHIDDIKAVMAQAVKNKRT